MKIKDYKRRKTYLEIKKSPNWRVDVWQLKVFSPNNNVSLDIEGIKKLNNKLEKILIETGEM